MNSSKSSADFLLSEFSKLRDEVLEAIKEIRALERYFLLVTGALLGWQLSSANIASPEFYALPLLMAVLFGIRVYALHLQIAYIGGYIKRIETEFIENDFGWERHLSGLKPKGLTLGRSEFAFWSIAVVVTAFIALKYWLLA